MRMQAGLFVVLVGMAMGGCAQEHHLRQVREPAYYVPTAAIVQTEGPQLVASSAAQALPSSDGDYYFPRGEKTAMGNIPLYGISSFAIFTYDTQRIASPGDGSGYRYRWGIQQGATVP